MKILVTGSSGNFGRRVVAELAQNGHEVIGADARLPEVMLCPSLIVDMKDAGEVYSVIYDKKPDGIINLAAIPRPGIASDRQTFLTNTEIAYNVFEAAAALGVKKIAHASTDSSYGFVFAKHQIMPKYLPVDEFHPQLPQDCYGGSKLINEQTAQIFSRANPDMQITCMRICWLIEPEILYNFAERNDTLESIYPEHRGLFSYIDMRDAAAGFRLALESELPGFNVFNLMAKDTTTKIETKKLIGHCFKDVELKKEFAGNEALFSSEKATRVLGWRQRYSWREKE